MGVSLDTAEEQRLAAEEYIAHLAQKGVPKPSWWKEFLQKIRMWWSNTRFGSELHMTDAQIETLLARAARKVRSRAVVKENLTTETDGYGKVRSGTEEVRYSVTEENGLERTETDEIKNFKRQLQGTKQWMKAPDGTQTNLTESQWLQVRTESFKKWFGDWELAALLNNAKKAWNDKGFTFTYRFSPSVELKQRLEDLLGHTVNILQIDGSTVRHIKNEHSDIKSETKKGQKARTAEDIVLIPYLLNNFDEAELSPKHDDNLGNRAITIKKQINGVSVIGTIERGKNGVYVVTNWQTVSAVQMQTTPGRNALSDADKYKIQQDIAKIKTGAENFSKIVDENGEPLVVYHGTNWDILEEPAGEAVFSDKYRGAGSGDNGFFGRGFYFTFGNGKASEGEAGYYGKNVFKFYLSIKKPFYFSETLLGWNGKRVFGDEVHSVEIVNAVNLFPELLRDFTLDTYDKNGDFAGEITLDKYARMFKKVYDKKEFLVRKTSNPNEIVVEADPVTRTEDGETWTEFEFSQRIYKPGDKTDMQLLFTHMYLSDTGFPDGRNFKVNIPYGLFREFYGEPEFRSWLENNGYDGVMQSKHGDEVVAFKSTQIKSATDNIGTFDFANPDIRFSLADYDEQTQDDIIAILRPFVRQQIDMEPERYIAYLKEKNINIPDEDAAVFFRLAVIENDKAARERIKRARDQWLFENFPLYGEVAEFAGGADFKIKPAGHEGEEFTGSFISQEYIKYSLKRPQGKKESDKSCKQYLSLRKEKGVWGAVWVR